MCEACPTRWKEATTAAPSGSSRKPRERLGLEHVALRRAAARAFDKHHAIQDAPRSFYLATDMKGLVSRRQALARTARLVADDRLSGRGPRTPDEVKTRARVCRFRRRGWTGTRPWFWIGTCCSGRGGWRPSSGKVRGATGRGAGRRRGASTTSGSPGSPSSAGRWRRRGSDRLPINNCRATAVLIGGACPCLAGRAETPVPLYRCSSGSAASRGWPRPPRQ